jgi:hypothetical protein
MAAKGKAAFAPPPSWESFKGMPGLVLGFHGCDAKVGKDLLGGEKTQLVKSENDYDWLGSGIYFWESNPWRALDFAEKAAAGYKQSTRGKIETPYAVGAIINLGACMNLLDASALTELSKAHQMLQTIKTNSGSSMPKNKGQELAARFLDKAVIEFAHTLREEAGLPNYDTVRAAFVEGQPLYENAGFHDKNHIQIAARNPDRILGYFRLPGL